MLLDKHTSIRNIFWNLPANVMNDFKCFDAVFMQPKYCFVHQCSSLQFKANIGDFIFGGLRDTLLTLIVNGP